MSRIEDGIRARAEGVAVDPYKFGGRGSTLEQTLAGDVRYLLARVRELEEALRELRRLYVALALEEPRP